ncbi:hypothetical protein [Actinophytocola sediminis]
MKLVHGKSTDKNRKAALESMLRVQVQNPNNPYYEQLRIPFCKEFPDHAKCAPPATFVEAAHSFLDACGFVIDVCDSVNVNIYLYEGDLENAAISAVALIPCRWCACRFSETKHQDTVLDLVTEDGATVTTTEDQPHHR